LEELSKYSRVPSLKILSTLAVNRFSKDEKEKMKQLPLPLTIKSLIH